MTYQSKGFLEKNRDNLSLDVQTLLSLSGDPLIKSLFDHSVKAAVQGEGSLCTCRDRSLSFFGGVVYPLRQTSSNIGNDWVRHYCPSDDVMFFSGSYGQARKQPGGCI